MCCLYMCEEDEQDCYAFFKRGVSQLHVTTFAVRGFVTHWLWAQDPCLASDRVLPNPTLSGSQTEVL